MPSHEVSTVVSAPGVNDEATAAGRWRNRRATGGPPARLLGPRSRRTISRHHSATSSRQERAIAGSRKNCERPCGRSWWLTPTSTNRAPTSWRRAHQLDADHPRARRQRDAIEDAAPHQPEVAVGVADVESEQDADGVVVQAPDHLAIPRVAAPDLEALHDVDLGRRGLDAADDLAGVVLGVTVGVEDPLLGGRGDAAAQRAAVAAVGRVDDDAQLGHLVAERLEDGDGAVGRPVVDDDDLEVGDAGVEGAADVTDHRRDRVLVVVAGEERRDRADLGVERRHASDGLEGGCDGLDLGIGQLGEAGQRDALGRPPLRLRARRASQMAVRRLLGEGERVVDPGRHAMVGERRSHRVAGGHPHDALVHDVVRVVRVPPGVRGGGPVAASDLGPAHVVAPQRGQLQAQPCRLELAEAVVLADLDVHVLGAGAVGPEPAGALGEVVVGRDDRPAVADPAEVLGRVEGVHRRRARDVVERAVRLGGILDHGQSEAEQGFHWRRPPVEVDDHDRRRAGGDRGPGGADIEGGRRRVDVDRHRSGAGGPGGRGRRHGRERRHDDLVAGSDAEGGEGQLEPAGPARHADDGMVAGRAVVEGAVQLALERRQLVTEEHRAGREDALQGRRERRVDATVSSRQVDEGDHERST